MSKYRQFIFKDYAFNVEAKTLELHYGYDDRLHFTEKFTFDFDFVKYDPTVLDRLCQLLFFIAGVSYYKAFLAPEIVVKAGEIDESLATFLSQTYQQGLGEFFYINQLDPYTAINFPVTVNQPLEQLSEANAGEGLLIGIGGGKDSLVTAEVLREAHPNIGTWSLGHRKQLEPLIERMGLRHFYVEREWDKQLLKLNEDGAYNGHVPISAIFAGVGSVVNVLAGFNDHIVSNESSASEPNLKYKGMEINHQYSKSLQFEQSFQGQLERSLQEGPWYHSFLRPLSELHIAKIFGQQYFDKYADVFSSCNRAFTHDSHQMFWCGECPKCAFVFLALTPFVEQSKLEKLFHNKNLLLEPGLEMTYLQLLGIEGDKPLECVGEIKESRTAMRLAQNVYPTLEKYQFDVPEDYNYLAVAEHNLPDYLFSRLQSFLQRG